MITQVHIQNFKSIRDVTVNLEPVTVLVGRSGTGKSNFLAAIRFLRDFLGSGMNAVNAANGWPRLVPANAQAAPLSIEISFRLSGYDEKFRYRLELIAPVANQPHQRRVGREELSLGDSVVFRRKVHGWEVQPSVTNLPQLSDDAVLGKLPTLSEAVLAFTALTAGIGVYDFPANIFGDDGSSTSKQAGSDGGLADDGGNFLSILKALTSDLRDQHARKTIIARLQQLNPSVRSIELDSITKPTVVVVGHEFGGKILDLKLAQESDGFRRFYAHLLALFQTPPKQLLMFEEPENGIYPGALEMLAEEFKMAPNACRGQVLLTTHSPGLLDHFDADAIRVVEISDKTAATCIAPLAPEQKEAIQQHLLDPGELLTTDEARAALTESEGASGS